MEKQILSFNDLPSALSLVINKLEILEEKFSTLMTQIQPDKGLEWLSVSELSEYLPTHPVEHTIYCWTSNKQIPFHKKGKRIMFLKSEIDEWMQDNKSRSPHRQQQVFCRQYKADEERILITR